MTDVAETEDPTVLVADDEPNVAAAYELWLPDEYEVRTAEGGRAALDAIDDDVDVLLLDRRMPDIQGDDVLSEVHARGYDPRVAMVTAVDPDFDIVDMPFDAYLIKPVDKEELLDTVDRLVSLSLYSEKVRKHYALVDKRAVLAAEMTDRELAESEAFDELTRRLDAVKEELDQVIASVDEETMEEMYRNLGS